MVITNDSRNPMLNIYLVVKIQRTLSLTLPALFLGPVLGMSNKIRLLVEIGYNLKTKNLVLGVELGSGFDVSG